MHLERNGRRSFSSGPQIFRAVYGIGPGETHGRGSGPPACPWDNNNIVLCVLNCSISTNRTTCVNVAIMIAITLLQWTQGTSAPLQRSVSRQSPSTCHTSQVSPPDSGNAFVLFPHCLKLLGKKRYLRNCVCHHQQLQPISLSHSLRTKQT